MSKRDAAHLHLSIGVTAHREPAAISQPRRPKLFSLDRTGLQHGFMSCLDEMPV